MAVRVRIPIVLRKLTQGAAEVGVSGADISAVIDDLEAKYPGFKERICDDTGKIRRFVNIFVNDEDIRYYDKEATAVKDEDIISIIPAIAGG